MVEEREEKKEEENKEKKKIFKKLKEVVEKGEGIEKKTLKGKKSVRFLRLCTYRHIYINPRKKSL